MYVKVYSYEMLLSTFPSRQCSGSGTASAMVVVGQLVLWW